MVYLEVHTFFFYFPIALLSICWYQRQAASEYIRGGVCRKDSSLSLHNTPWMKTGLSYVQKRKLLLNYTRFCFTNTNQFQCLAVIKFRNPQIWGKLQDVVQAPAESQAGNSINSIVPQELSHLKLNRSLFLHLESVYQYQNDKSLKGNIDIQKSFADDVSDGDVLKWFWPNYKLLAVILSLKDCSDILRLFQCFQMFLISFSCFHCKHPKFLTDVMIAKFVKSELVTIKERPPRSTAKFIPLGSTFHGSFQLNRMCTLHFDTVRRILELQSQVE